MRVRLMLSSAAIGLLLTSSFVYAQTSGDRKKEQKRTEEPGRGAAQHNQRSVRERAHRAHRAHKRTQKERRRGAGREKKRGDRQATDNAAGKRKESSGTAPAQNEHNQNQTSRNDAEKPSSAQQGNRSRTATDTKSSPSTGNAQNAPSVTGAKTNRANRANDTQVDQKPRVTSETQLLMSESFSRDKLAAPERDLNISIRVGEAVPPHIRLHRLPPEIVSIEPGYRDYEYFATDENIVIVEPGTHRIVSEVPRDPSRARAQLSGGSVSGGAGSTAAAGGANLNCKVMRRDASGHVAEVEPSIVGANAPTDSLSVTVQLPGRGTSVPIALGASSGDIVVATQSKEDCTVMLEPQLRYATPNSRPAPAVRGTFESR